MTPVLEAAAEGLLDVLVTRVVVDLLVNRIVLDLLVDVATKVVELNFGVERE